MYCTTERDINTRLIINLIKNNFVNKEELLYIFEIIKSFWVKANVPHKNLKSNILNNVRNDIREDILTGLIASIYIDINYHDESVFNEMIIILNMNT